MENKRSLKCPECGARITQTTNNRYINCEYCGSKIENPAYSIINKIEDEFQEAANPLENATNSMPWFLIILVLFFFPPIGIFLIFIKVSSKQKK